MMVGLIGFAFCQSLPSAQNVQDRQGLQGTDRHCYPDPSPVGPLDLDLGNNACQCPEALAYLERSAQKGVIGKKRTL